LHWHAVFNYILQFLYMGCQCKQLPIEGDAQGGVDPLKSSISGHSAGAHLCAEVLAHDWRERCIDPGFIAGAVMIRGVFDPGSAIRTTVNVELKLTREIAERRNVGKRVPLVNCPS